MSFAEVLFFFLLFLWPFLEFCVFKAEPVRKTLWRWGLLVAACQALAAVMLYQASGMLGGKLIPVEGVFYGGLLAGMFSFLQIFKRVLSWGLERVAPGKPVVRGVIYYVVLIVVAVPFFIAVTSVHHIKVGNALDPRSALGLPYEDVAFKAKDGTRIRGWYVPAVSDQAVLIAHGLGANRSNFIETVGLWHQLGFNVLIFDFRGHGDSEGHTTSFGYRERRDVMAGWAYLTVNKRFQPENVTGYGVSFGGAALIHTARDRQFKQLVIDSAFASLDTMAMRTVERNALIPPFLRGMVKNIGLFFLRVELGYDIHQHEPVDSLDRISNTPILFIHGKNDPLIDVAESQRLYDRAKKPKQIFILNTQGHFTTLHDPQYPEIIRNFLKENEKPVPHLGGKAVLRKGTAGQQEGLLFPGDNL